MNSQIFHATADDEHARATRANILHIISQLPYYLAILVKSLANIVIQFVLHIDDQYTVNVADEQISDGQYVSLLRTIGAHFEEFQHSDLARYLATKEQEFNKIIWNPGDLNDLINDVVKFCSDINEYGTVNTNAIKSVLSKMLKNQISYESERIETREIIILFSERTAACGVMRVDVTGNNIRIDSACCFKGKVVDLKIKRCGLIFLDTHDILQTIRTFVETSRQ